jgi:hypothetical protein
MSNSKWVPEICYEEMGREGETFTGGLPFIDVPDGHSMPGVLFMYESRKVDDECLEKEIILHSYANMMQLKKSLSEEDYDNVRRALGLKSLSDAVVLGKEINDKIVSNIRVSEE